MSNAPKQTCPECGTVWSDGKTCEDYLHQIYYWEGEGSPEVLAVHHLMVLSYHLQHPSLYSPEGLDHAKQLLVDFLERCITPAEVHRRDRGKVDSGNRTYKITGTATSYGSYRNPIGWKMSVRDVVEGGLDKYGDNVKAWAWSILEELKISGNLA